MAVHFLYIRAWGLPFLYMFQIRNSLLVGVNRSRLIIYGSLVETIANIFLDYSFIFGHFGFPKMGFNGAAVASVISEIIAFLTVYAVMRIKKINKEFNIGASIQYNAANAKLV
jgi:Na+-driven multidrug efflux pump